MEGLGYAGAVLLAAVFLRAGAAKVARPVQTATSFVALGVPAAGIAARAVPLLELTVATALLASPRGGAVAALALLVPFTAVLARAVVGGSATPCNCFGAARVEPVSWADVARNVFLGALAVVAAITAGPEAPDPVPALLTVAAMAGAWLLFRALRWGFHHLSGHRAPPLRKAHPPD